MGLGTTTWLVAYCGRLIEGNPSQDNPKYKLPGNFRKELELFNWHRAIASRTDDESDCLVLVESFLSAVKLHAWQYTVASPMGRSLSKYQIKLIKDANFDEVVLLLDGDDPGRAAVTTVGRQLLEAGIAHVTAPVVPENFKPHKLKEDEIDELLETSIDQH